MHSICASRFKTERPAERRTLAAGRTIRVAAIIRTKSIASILSLCPSGVPAIGTSALMGTLSGCGSNPAKIRSMDALSLTASPMPMMPPQHICSPAARTASLHPKRANTAHHIEYRIERLSVTQIPPGRAHAKTIGSGGFRVGGGGQHGLRFHHIGLVEANLAVTRGLRAIGAILRAAASLYAEEARFLDVADIVKEAMNAVRLGD
jgi:hypothetical protein